MERLKINLQSLQDAANGKPLIPGVTPDNSEYSRDITVGICDGGLQSGGTSIIFAIKAADGTYHFTEITEGHMEALYQTFQGAQQRFADEKRSN